MNKIIVSSLVALVALSANVVSAQGYYFPAPPSYNNYNTGFQQPYSYNTYPSYNNTYPTSSVYPTSYSGACVNLVSDLQYGSKGSQVSQLQTFLVSQNYPGGGSWMITGNFKSATLAAVRTFQQQQGLSVTGIVDSTTRAAISRVSCGGYSGGYNMYNYNTNPYTIPFNNYNTNTNVNTNINNTNCYYTYPYTCNNYNNYNTYPYGSVSISSLSVTAGPPGTGVTIHGYGFDYSNNTVNFGGTTLTGIPSYNGTSLTFTVPAYAVSGSINVSVMNTRGTSNAIAFNVSSQGGCGSYYPYNSNCCNNSTYSYGSTCPSTTPYVTYMSPNSGAVGSSITVYGSGFSSQNNTVHFGSGTIANIPSYNGTSLSFTVPSQLSGYGSAMVIPGAYNVSVSNSTGYTSNAIAFTVTSYGGSYGAPIINSVNGPTSLNTGVQGTWTISVNNPTNSYMTTSVNWGDTGGGYVNAAAPQTTYQQGQNTLTFTHAYYASGTYTITFTVANASGQQNTSTATVNVGGGSYGNVVLSSITPMSGHVGSQIVLNGSNFTQLENTVRFGIGGTQHVPSQNGTTIYYTIPAFVSPCDLAAQGGLCAQIAQQVLPGPIQVYVTNSNGTTNTILFQVQ